MTQTPSEGWLEVAAKFWTARRETPTSEIEDMADFGALVAKLGRQLTTINIYKIDGFTVDHSSHIPTDDELLAALKREIGGKG